MVPDQLPEQNIHNGKRRRQRLHQSLHLQNQSIKASSILDVDVGRRLRELRNERGYSIRLLAENSGLNFNTLSLIENGRTSPSVSTLQQLALALDIPMATFFETGVSEKKIIYQKAGQHPRAAFSHGILEDLGTGLARREVEPFVVTLEPGADSGPTPIVHTGLEFVYCLDGQIVYSIEEQTIRLEPGDSLIFEAHLPHRWRNETCITSRSLLLLCPADTRDRPTELHFITE